ncbi:MAG: insulinase family protein [Planctomycetes bacterium]|nr:insulinase family protein [Planctomycetota bacterium]
MQFRRHTLSNGLEIVSECVPGAHSMGLAFFVRTGARDESEEISGVSHFLEHMVFKGTPQRSAADVNRELDEIGSHSNAYTSEEQTVYHAAVLPEYQGRLTELLADILRPSLRLEDFETEKSVILEEIAKYEDEPPYGAFEKCMAAYFGTHPLAKSILGTTASVSALTPEKMRAYFEQRYSAANIVLAAAGNVDFEQLVRDTERYCGDWKQFPVERAAPRSTAQSSFREIVRESATQQYAIQIGAGPSASDPDRYANRLLASIVGDSSGSRLFWELVDTGRAEWAVMEAHEYQGTGIMITYLSSSPESMPENIERARAVLRDVEQNGIREDELLRAKSKICSQLVLSSERPSSRMFAVGNGWIQRREYRTVRDALNAYQAVTTADISNLVEKYRLTTQTTVSIGPGSHD